MRTERLPKVFALPKAPACQHRRQAGADDDGTPANHLLVRFVFHRRLLSNTNRQGVLLCSSRRTDEIQKDLVALVKGRDPSAKISRLSTEDYCAAHLASLCDAAYSAYQNSNGNGKFVDYVDLPDSLIEDIIPNHFGQSIDDKAKSRILKVSGTYSKARTLGKTWQEDSQQKEDAARPEIRAASAKYLQPVYEKLKRVS